MVTSSWEKRCSLTVQVPQMLPLALAYRFATLPRESNPVPLLWKALSDGIESWALREVTKEMHKGPWQIRGSPPSQGPPLGLPLCYLVSILGCV